MWYYALNQEQHGPVNYFDVVSLIGSGTITPSTLVWQQGMDEWQPAGETELAQLFRKEDAPDSQGSDKLTVETKYDVPAHTKSTQLLSMSGHTLSGRWGQSIGMALAHIGVLMGLSFLPLIGGLVSMLFTGALAVGANRFWLNLLRGGPTKIDQLFSGMNRFGPALITYLLFSLISVVVMVITALPGGILLGIGISQLPANPQITDFNALTWAGIILVATIPTLVATYIIARLSFCFYVLSDDDQIGAVDALTRSWNLMTGNFWRLMILWTLLSLIMLGCLLTLGIGFIWAAPYMQVAMASFYESLLTEEYEKG